MANFKISQLPAATTLTTGDLIPVVQGGVTKQATPDLLPVSTATASAIAAKAPLASPAFTGTPTIGGVAVAKTSDITTAIAGLVNGASTALDTLAEIDAQLAADEGSAAALATLVATKAAAANVPTYATAGLVQVSNSSGDAATLAAALNAQTTGGKVTGAFGNVQGTIARISSPTTINLGYSNTQAANWGTDTTTEKVRLRLDILPDAGLGAALTIKGGYGVELDINVLGGGTRGTVTDAAMAVRSTAADASVVAGTTPGTTTVTSASANFTTADIGVPVAVPGAGSAGATAYGTITAVTSSTTATLNFQTAATVSSDVIQIGSYTISSPTAIAAGLAPGAVVFLNGAGPSPEGITQPLAASVRTVNAGAGTFTVSEGNWSPVTGATMNWFDVAVRLEDMVGCKLNIYGKGFQGYLLAADATNDTTRRLRSCDFPSIVGNSCGGTVFWKSIEAFGSIGHIMSNTTYGDYFGMGADLHWDHYEGGVPQPTSQLARTYLWFDRYGQVNNLSVSAGDRPTEVPVLLTGDSASNAAMGRFSQIRATMYQAVGIGATYTSGSNLVTNVVSSSLTFKVGQTIIGPNVPDGTTITAVTGAGNGYTSASPGTITMSANATATTTNQQVFGVTADGVKLIGVSSVTIGMLDTARAVAGLRIIGGGSVGIRVLNHKSQGSDLSALVIQPGTTAAPRIDITTDYRFQLSYGIDLASGISSSADIRIRGHVEGVHQATGGASGKYAARSASTAAVLDIAGLRLKAASGMLGLINPATVTLKGVHQARLESGSPAKGTLYYANGTGDFTALPAGSNGQVPTWQADGSIAPATPTVGGGGAAATSYFDPSLYTKYLAWTMDNAACAQGVAGVAATGRAQYSMIPVTTAITATNLSVLLATLGSGTTWTSGQNFLALYDSTGNLLGQTADITSILSATAANGEVIAPLATPVSVTTGRVYVVILLNWSAGTVPTFLAAKSLGGTSMNLGTPAAFPRSASDSIVRTAPVSAKAITALSAAQQALIWAAIS